MYKFTANELKVFKSVCLGNESIGDINKSANVSINTIYRSLESLRKKKTISNDYRRERSISISSHSHATALKDYIMLSEFPLDAFVGSKFLILLSISSFPKDIRRISKETRLKGESVRTLVWRLKRYGMIDQKGKSMISVSPSNVHLMRFLQDFSKGSCNAILEERAKSGIMLWNEGLQFIFSAKTLNNRVDVRRTGITAMSDYGLQFISDTDYYHYAYWHPFLRSEDVAIHNLLTNPTSVRTVSYSLLLLRKTGFDPSYFVREAKYVGISKLARGIRNYLIHKEVHLGSLPDERDLEALFSQYGVK